MQENDKSFQAVTLSLVLHATLVWLLTLTVPSSNSPDNTRIEIEIINDNDDPKGMFVKNLIKKDLPELPSKKEADFLSQQKQRVAQEMIAPKIGEPENILKKTLRKKINLDPKTTSSGFYEVSPPQELSSYTSDLQSQFNFDLRKIEKGNITLLNTDYSTFASFYDRISPNIRYQWLSGVSSYLSDPVIMDLMRLNKESWITRIEVILNKNGYFEKAIVVNSSGSQQLDRAATESFKRAAPFINPPHGLVGADGKIRINAMYVITLNPNYYARTKKQ